MKPAPVFLRYLVLWFLTACLANTAGAAGVTWTNLSFSDVLAEASRTGKKILVDVHAGHCASCKQMEIDVWETAEGAELAKGMIAVRLDSTLPESSELRTRYPVTGLPTVLFLQPDGTELDRIVGYDSKPEFLREARPLKQGLDPLPMMEAALEAHPDSVPLILPVLERYLNRLRDADAQALLDRLLELDRTNRSGQPERALLLMAKHASYFRNDQETTLRLWKTLVERFPSSSAIHSGVEGTYKALAALGQESEWLPWICGLLKQHPKLGRLHYAAAIIGSRSSLRDPCLAQAARNARALGVGGARLDTLAIELEGGTVPDRGR